MSQTKNISIKFKSKEFFFDEFVDTTKLSTTSARNLLSKLMKLGMISSKTLSNDKRKKFYFIEWKFIVNKIKNPDEDIYDIINNLNLSDYTGKHVLLNKFEVIDSDTNLNKLILRHWDKTPSDDYVYLSIGTTRDVLTIDHEIE